MLKLFLGLMAFAFCIYIVGLIGVAIGAVFELLFQYWWVLALGMSLAVFIYFYRNYRIRKKNEQKTKELRKSFDARLRDVEPLSQEQQIAIDKKLEQNRETSSRALGELTKKTGEQPTYLGGSYQLIRSFYTKVVGGSHRNDDGTSRQEIISRCDDGEQITLEWGTFNGEPACSVISDHGQIGFLRAELAADLHRDYIDGYEGSDVFFFFAQIGNITGGENGLHYGCNLKISIYGLASPYRDEMFPVAVEIILEAGKASVTQLQKRLHIGYSRASKLMDELEENGIVGPFCGSKPREVLISKQQWDAERKR